MSWWRLPAVWRSARSGLSRRTPGTSPEPWRRDARPLSCMRPGMVPSPIGRQPDIIGTGLSEVVDKILEIDLG